MLQLSHVWMNKASSCLSAHPGDLESSAIHCILMLLLFPGIQDGACVVSSLLSSKQPCEVD